MIKTRIILPVYKLLSTDKKTNKHVRDYIPCGGTLLEFDEKLLTGFGKQFPMSLSQTHTLNTHSVREKQI